MELESKLRALLFQGTLKLTPSDIPFTAFPRMLQVFDLNCLTFTNAQVIHNPGKEFDFYIKGDVDLISQCVKSASLYFEYPPDKTEQEVQFQFAGYLPGFKIKTLIERNWLPYHQLYALPELMEGMEFSHVELMFDSEGETLYVGKLETDISLDIFQSMGLKLQDLGFEYKRSFSENQASLRLFAGIQIGGTTADTIIALPIGGFLSSDTWSMTIHSTLQLGAGLKDLLALLDSIGFAQLLPPDFFPDQLAQIPTIFIEHLRIDFNPLQKKISYLSTHIETVHPFCVGENLLTLKNVGMKLSIDLTAREPVLSLTLFGAVRVTDAALCWLWVHIPSDSEEDWTFFSESTLDLSKIEDLSNLPIHTPLGDFKFPQGLLKVNRFELRDFEITFNPIRRTLRAIRFAFEAGVGCEIIPGVTLENPSISLDIQNPLGNTTLEPRKITGSISSMVGLFGMHLFFDASREDEGWTFSGGMAPNQQIELGGLIKDLEVKAGITVDLPLTLQSLAIHDLQLSLSTNPGSLHLTTSTEATGLIPIREKECILGLKVDITYAPENTDQKLTGNLNGRLTIGKTSFEALFDFSNPRFRLLLAEGSILDVKEMAEFFLGHGLFDTLPSDLTQNLAGIKIEKFTAGIDFLNRGLNLELITTLKNIHLGTDDLLIEKAGISFVLDVSSTKKYCRVEVTGSGSIGEAVNFKDCQFLFICDRHNGETDWKLTGDFQVEILGHNSMVSAGYQKIQGAQTMALSLHQPFPALEFPGEVSFVFSDCNLMVKKEHGRTAWNLAQTFCLKTPGDFFSVHNGTTTLINESARSGLCLFAGEIRMQIPGLSHLPWMTMIEPKLEFIYEKTGKQWSCQSQTHLQVHNVPELLKVVFPSGKLKAACAINAKTAEFSVGLEDGLIPIPVPPDLSAIGIPTKDLPNLGYAYIGIDEIKVSLQNGGSLTARLQMGLPKGLNDIFVSFPEEKTTEKRDHLEVFRVYDPEGEKELVGLELTLNAAQGLVCAFSQSPFKFFAFRKDADGNQILDIDLKEFGHITLDVPKFAMKPDGSFSASGGFNIIKDLQIPLTPLKFLLDRCGLPEVARNLKPGIPIMGIKFYDETTKRFDTQAFIKLLTSNLGLKTPPSMPTWIDAAFRSADDLLSRLPSALLSYGNIEVPRRLHFKIDFSVEGSLNLKISMKDPQEKEQAVPLRFLVVNPPYIMGFELYSLSFGELFGGVLFRFDLDLKIDSFDLLTVATALLIPFDRLDPVVRDQIADPRTIHQSIRIKDLVTVIIYESGIPIPIPLFYDELSIAVRNLDGLEVKSSFGFPVPQLKINEFAILVSECIKLFRDGKDLDLKKLETVSLGDFIIGPNYVRFPKFVSTEKDRPGEGKMLGTEQGFTIKPVLFLAAIVNAIKNGSINRLIRMVEIDRRVNTVEMLLFKVFNAYFAYALTTPKEFSDIAYPLLVQKYASYATENHLPVPLHTSAPGELLRLLAENDSGRPVSAQDEGLVLFLRGGMNIGDAFVLETSLGLVVGGPGGFRTGISYYGFVADIIEARLLGFVKLAPESKTEILRLLGKASFSIFRHEIFHGFFELTNEHLVVTGKLDVFPPDWPLVLKGYINGYFSKDRLYIDNDARFELGLLKASAHVTILAEKNNNLLKLDLVYPNAECHIFFSRISDATGGSLDLRLQLIALRLLELSSELHVTYNLETGIFLSGRSFMAIGPKSLRIARIETNLTGALDLKKGFLGIRSELAPGSFLFGPNCRATGGFAFYSWFQTGDFVLTIGGYHPRFRPPVHYPLIPRVGIYWQIDNNTSLTGESYFALTPSCLMLGGKLQFVFQWWRVKAWFLAQADFVCQWQPVYYSARVSLIAGVSYRGIIKTYTAELAADLELWGPEFGGYMHIEWWIISFDIKFGLPCPPTPAALNWNEFGNLLPAEDRVCQIKPDEGIRETEARENQQIWVINPDEFRFSTETAIPSGEIYVNDRPAHDTAREIHIRPMRRKGLRSAQRIVIKRNGETHDTTGWGLAPITGNVPDALWGDYTSTDINREPLLKGNLSGLMLSPPPSVQGRLIRMGIEHLTYDPVELPPLPFTKAQTEEEASTPPHAVESGEILQERIMDPTGPQNRQNEIYELLKKMQIYTGPNDLSDPLLQAAEHHGFSVLWVTGEPSQTKE